MSDRNVTATFNTNYEPSQLVCCSVIKFSIILNYYHNYGYDHNFKFIRRYNS